MRLARLVVPVVLLATVVSGCGGHKAVAGRPSANADVTLSVRTVPGLGAILVTHGWTLYMYPPDQDKRVTCTKVDDCMSAWPPLFVGAGHTVIAGTGVKQNLIGTTPGDGGQVVTYNHWPLYYYIGDRSAEALNGQGQGFNWYVMAPDGAPNKSPHAPSSG